MLLLVAGSGSGCIGTSPNSRMVTATIANSSTHELNGVKLECAGHDLRAGILQPGISATILNVPWPQSPGGKVLFIDYQTKKPYSVEISLLSINEQVFAGKCRHVIIRILDYDKAQAECE